MKKAKAKPDVVVTPLHPELLTRSRILWAARALRQGFKPRMILRQLDIDGVGAESAVLKILSGLNRS